MDKHAWGLLTDRLDRMEDKLDSLIQFKYWFIGVGGAVSCVVSFLVTVYFR